MQTHKIITIILIILAIFLGVSILFSNKTPQIIDEYVATPTPVVIPTVTTTSTSAGAISTATTTKPLAQTFPKNVTLSISNSYTFPDGSILTIKQINDSRCATDVQCIWTGNVVVKLNIKKGNTSEDFELKYSINNNETSVYKYKEYKLEISNLQPNIGKQGDITELKDYRVTINISK